MQPRVIAIFYVIPASQCDVRLNQQNMTVHVILYQIIVYYFTTAKYLRLFEYIAY